jgi:carbamoyl-phosphate synthase large subunit
LFFSKISVSFRGKDFLPKNMPDPLRKKAIVLGAGPYCIGSSVEFDWGCVNAVKTLKEEGYETIMINYNPETVSTDYDTCDTLYFDELSLERVLDIYDVEDPEGVVLFTGGQIPNNIATKLGDQSIRIMGTDPKSIHQAESRQIFSALLDELKIDQPIWREFSDIKDAKNFSDEVGYPVLVRPSYVLSGAAMAVALSESDLENYLSRAVKISTEAPIVISKFEVGAREIELDAVAANGEILIFAISEHVENAGVHSGDATIVFPPQKTYLETIRRVKHIGKILAKRLSITGPFNIQFLAKDNYIKVIELNLRASRSFPFVSKVTGHNFIEIATKAAIGKVEDKTVRAKKYQTLDLDYVAVKAPQFSFSRLRGADPVLSVEMSSTGEVACFGENLEEGFLKAILSTGFRMPKKNICLSIGKMKDKISFLESAKALCSMGYKLFGTEGTADFFSQNGIAIEVISKQTMKGISEMDLVVNIPRNFAHEEKTNGYLLRRKAVDGNIPLLTNLQLAKLLVKALAKFKNEEQLPITAWDEFLEKRN